MFIDLRFRVCGSQIFLTRSSDAECSTLMGVMCPVTAFGIYCSHHAANIHIGCICCADNTLPACYSWAFELLVVGFRMCDSLQAISLATA